MSTNPEAFNFLRHKAYAFVSREGKDAARLYDYCNEALARWSREEGSGSGLTDAEARQIVSAVTDWTIQRYNPPRRRPKRSREERASEMILAPLLLDVGEELFGSRTVRNAARVIGRSKSTVARHLRGEGIAPRRQKKIEALPATSQRVLALLTETFPRDRSGLISLDELGFALWDELRREKFVSFPVLAPSTRSKRRKTLKESLHLIQQSSLGLHFHITGDTVIVWQGRRLPPYKELGAWLLNEEQRRGTRPIRIPAPASLPSLYWDDPWLRDVLSTYELCTSHNVEDLGRMEAMLRVMRLAGNMLLDPSPILRTVSAARRILTSSGDYLPEQLRAAARQITDREPDVAKHVQHIASVLEYLFERSRSAPSPSEFLEEMDIMLHYMSPLGERAPLSYARVRYLEQVIHEDYMHCDDAPSVWHDLRQLEKDGAWATPSDQDLAAMLPH